MNFMSQTLKKKFNNRETVLAGWTSIGHPQISEMLSMSGVDFIGIDIANEDADEVIDIIDFKTDKIFDLIICYGSINFYDEKWVEDRLEKVVNLLDDTPGSRICMKVNPGNPHADGTMLEFFPWTMDYARDISAKYGLVIENFRTKGSTGGRFKFDFVRSDYTYSKQAEDIYAFV